MSHGKMSALLSPRPTPRPASGRPRPMFAFHEDSIVIPADFGRQLINMI
jgi:hypothetical protein